MLEKLFTTKMSADKRTLQIRFAKIQNKNKVSKVLTITTSIVITLMILATSVVIAVHNATDYTYDNIIITLDNSELKFNNSPFFYNNTVYLPLIELNDRLGLSDKTKITTDGNQIMIQIDGHESSYEINIGDNKIVYYNIWNNSKADVLTPYEPVVVNAITYIPFDYIEWIYNRYNYSFNIDFTYKDINNNVPYHNNAEFLTYSYICDLQFQVDNGHFPWRLDYEQVIQMYLSGIGENVENGKLISFSGDSTKCSGDYKISDKTYRIELFKPVDTSEHGIWIVRSFEKIN